MSLDNVRQPQIVRVECTSDDESDALALAQTIERVLSKRMPGTVTRHGALVIYYPRAVND